MGQKKNQVSEGKFMASEVIAKKRDGGILSKEEINWFVSGITDGHVADYQTTALLMAIYINGMNKTETADLTDAVLASGKQITFAEDGVVDKHSTGGVGDKTSFILGPIAASCGAKVPMIAGRGLGHTGGTVDKILAIKGYKTELSLKKFKESVLKHNIAMIGQTDDFATADRTMYALRDVTGTVPSLPLITASIMSKKLASGPKGLVFDVKTGNGAFLQKISDSRKLAKSLIDTGNRFDKKVIALITDMNQPLGRAVGNALEIRESIETLKGEGPKDLTDLSIELAGTMIYLAGIKRTRSAGIRMAKEAIKSGQALAKFKELVALQGGDTKVFDNLNLLEIANEETLVLSLENGFISKMDTQSIGLSCVKLGGGRMKAEDQVDTSVGFYFHKKIGDKVKVGDPILTIYHHQHQADLVEQIREDFQDKYIKISKNKVSKPPLIYEIHQ